MISSSWMTKNSMSESLRDLDRVEDRIRQHWQVDKRPVLAVEGPADFLVLREHLSQAVLFPADGKKNVLRAIESLGEWGLNGFRGLVDADFDEPEEGREDYRVLLYDGRDLEGMLVEMGVLAHLLEHQGSAAKLGKLGGAERLCKQLAQEAHAVAEIRAANEREAWGLRFDSVDVAAKADRDTLKLDVKRYVSALIQASDTSVQSSVVLESVTGDSLDGRGARGRDIVAFAGVALRRKAGSLPAAATTVDVLSAQLRSSAGLALSRSKWLANLRESVIVAAHERNCDAA